MRGVAHQEHAAAPPLRRDPVMDATEAQVRDALESLRARSLVIETSGGRVMRYEENARRALGVPGEAVALLATLMLRGPQTAAELHTRCERLATFADLDDVRQTLDRLAQRQPTLALNIGRASGQREDRYMHLLSGPIDAGLLLASVKSAASAAPERADTSARIEALEAAVQALRSELDALAARLP